MVAPASTLRPLFQAFAVTGLGVLAFAGLSTAGFAAETSLIAVLILAGGLNIVAQASLNGAFNLPTSEMPVGDLSR